VIASEYRITWANHSQCLEIQQGFVNIENEQGNGHDDSSVTVLTYAPNQSDRNGDRITINNRRPPFSSDSYGPLLGSMS
jgi:hypothetical protein